MKTLDRPEHRKLARDMAEESFVLAINQNGTLPIKGIRSKRHHFFLTADYLWDIINGYIVRHQVEEDPSRGLAGRLNF